MLQKTQVAIFGKLLRFSQDYVFGIGFHFYHIKNQSLSSEEAAPGFVNVNLVAVYL